ncbi:MAG: type II toxin-antitoxin system RelB/DinJ family antitoxin [Prevotella sp.]|jgi:DNA-damage-inducible protein J|nr:type II toxin-antitoxin system RelB/DinJ family antitoxin [Prevotella sp.]
MAKTASTYIRIDPQVKADVEEIFAQYGMTLSQAVNIFIHQARNVGGLPFDLRPNKETVSAMKETEQIINNPNRKTYNNFAEVIGEVTKDEV